jgi:CHASE3 domain sensor protein
MSAWKFQHCLDHLNGMLTSDIGLEIDEMFDNATEEERAEVLRMYAESLDIRAKEMQEMIKSDKDLADIDNAAKFIASVKTGETILDNSKETE